MPERGYGTPDSETERWRGSVDATLKHIESVIVMRAEAQKEALRIASDALTIRLEHANGLIQQMRDQRASTVTLDLFRGLEKEVDELQKSRADTEGRRAGSERLNQLLMLLAGAVIGALVAVGVRMIV